MGVGAGTHGFFGESHIAREIVNLLRESYNKKRALDAGGQLQRKNVMHHCSLERGTMNGAVRMVSGERVIWLRLWSFELMINRVPSRKLPFKLLSGGR